MLRLGRHKSNAIGRIPYSRMNHELPLPTSNVLPIPNSPYPSIVTQEITVFEEPRLI